MSRRTVAVLLGVAGAFGVAGTAVAAPTIPAPPPTLHCHTPWQFPHEQNGRWTCIGGHGPVVLPGQHR
ncbi:hypothetical protein [Nocardia miyunensis]|uniref:hypothetical protein n=1 Tax=Nocardia miyunensis TaxID=282684 RepID=UPI00082F32C9|nr:hypothetical protein [Nocardia miyunensis]